MPRWFRSGKKKKPEQVVKKLAEDLPEFLRTDDGSKREKV